MKNLTPFVAAYLACALWSSTDDAGNPLDRDYSVSDIQGETLDKAIKDCEKFQGRNAVALAGYYKRHDEEHAGHDFWLSRNGHGAGYFDDGYDALQEAARKFGTADLYIGDDKKLYFY